MELQVERHKKTSGRLGTSIAGSHEDVTKWLLTRPFKIGPRASGRLAHETDANIAARAAGKSDEEIRELVHRLHCERATLLERIRPDIAQAA